MDNTFSFAGKKYSLIGEPVFPIGRMDICAFISSVEWDSCLDAAEATEIFLWEDGGIVYENTIEHSFFSRDASVVKITIEGNVAKFWSADGDICSYEMARGKGFIFLPPPKY